MRKLHSQGVIRALGVVVAVLAVAGGAQAVIVDHVLSDGISTPSDATPVNTSAPTDDPGWYRTAENRSAIYLGNQWVLTARHAGLGSTITLPGGTYEVVPGSNVQLTNPSGNFGGVNLTDDSDLLMFRIKPESTTGLTPEQSDPNLAADPFGTGTVNLASTNPSIGTEIVMIGRGRARKVNTSDPRGHTSFPTGHDGFDVDTNDSNRIKTWGTNRIAEDKLFETNRNDSDNLFPVKISQWDVIAQNVQFDSTEYSIPNADTPTMFEAQAASGDSGGPVFVQENGEWVLAGLMHAIAQENGQPGRAAVFGNLTLISDLSQTHYANQINALLADDFATFESVSGATTDLEGYSIAGDINLDGVVSGDGTGSVETDDLAAFIAGWKHEQATADVISWTKGDLTQDGVTDLNDFALLRNAFNGGVSVSQLSTLLAGTAVPEPATAALAAATAALLLCRRR